MNRAERVQKMVNRLHQLDGVAASFLIGWITGCVEPGNGFSDTDAREHVQEAIEAYERYVQERREMFEREVGGSVALTDELVYRALAEPVREAAGRWAGEVPGEVYERDDEPVPVVDPSTVVGWPVGGGR